MNSLPSLLAEIRKRADEYSLAWDCPLDAFEARVRRVHENTQAVPLLSRETAQILSIIREVTEARDNIHRLLEALTVCMEQRDRYYPGQHHNLGYSPEHDNEQLRNIIAGEL